MKRSAELVDQVREHAARHPSAHPAYHKHCHLHPDDICPSCQWLRGLIEILDSNA